MAARTGAPLFIPRKTTTPPHNPPLVGGGCGFPIFLAQKIFCIFLDMTPDRPFSDLVKTMETVVLGLN